MQFDQVEFKPTVKYNKRSRKGGAPKKIKLESED